MRSESPRNKREPAKMTILLHRVRAEQHRQGDRPDAYEAVGREHRAQCDEPARGEHDRDLQAPARDRAVGQRLIGRQTDPPLLELDLPIERCDCCRHSSPSRSRQSVPLTFFIERAAPQT